MNVPLFVLIYLNLWLMLGEKRHLNPDLGKPSLAVVHVFQVIEVIIPTLYSYYFCTLFRCRKIKPLVNNDLVSRPCRI